MIEFLSPCDTEDACSQQIKLCSTIHTPLYQFQTIDGSFHWALIPCEAQSCAHRRFVSHHSLGKTHQFFNPTALDLL